MAARCKWPTCTPSLVGLITSYRTCPHIHIHCISCCQYSSYWNFLPMYIVNCWNWSKFSWSRTPVSQTNPPASEVRSAIRPRELKAIRALGVVGSGFTKFTQLHVVTSCGECNVCIARVQWSVELEPDIYSRKPHLSAKGTALVGFTKFTQLHVVTS